MTVGILALQGAFAEHRAKLEALGQTCVELRCRADLDRPFDRLVLCGGESTAQAKLLRELDMFDGLQRRIRAGMPTLGTCAGLVLLARRVEGSGDVHGLDSREVERRVAVQGFGTLPATVCRNAYGRQLGSFHTVGHFGVWDDVPMTFIRAPFVTEVEPACEVLAEVEGRIVGVRHRNQIGVAFHPELDADDRIHRLFLSLEAVRRGANTALGCEPRQLLHQRSKQQLSA